MINIGSINVEIVHGDLTKDNSDAIVNSTNSSLDLTQGVLLNRLYIIII